jgi:cytochrome c oxidase subunit 4
MAHKDPAPQGSHGGEAAHAPAAGGHSAAHGAHAHPTWKQYKWVALILTLITVVEVWIYYIPSFVASKLFVPALLIMSAVKFAIVVLYYMHLKYDARLFRALFTGPLIIAVVTIISLLFLFGHIAVRLGS